MIAHTVSILMAGWQEVKDGKTTPTTEAQPVVLVFWCSGVLVFWCSGVLAKFPMYRSTDPQITRFSVFLRVSVPPW
jgi:hypothetical protein